MYTVSDRDLDYGARTLLAEAGNQGRVGQAAVAHVIKNRLENGFGGNIAEIITKPYQFEPWLHAGKGKDNDPLRYSADSPEYKAAVDIFRSVLAGEIPDPTKGATHFYAPQAQKQLAQLDNRKVVPDWATPESKTATIGEHEFYNVGPKKAITVTRPARPAGEGEYELPDYMKRAAQEYGWQEQGTQNASEPYKRPDYMERAAQEYKWDDAPKAPQVKRPEELMAPEDWGAGRSFATGLTLGGYPYLEAGVETLADYAGGRVKEPSLSTLITREPTGMSGAFNKNLQNVQKAREAYQQYAPVVNALAEGAGTLAPTLVGGVAAARGLAAGGRYLTNQAPAYAKPVLENIGRFASGEAGESAKGLTGFLTRTGSNATQGALYGAGQGLATHYLQPDHTWGQSAEIGALGGAIGSVLLNPLFRGMGHAINPEILPAERVLAQDANQTFPGLNIRPGQVAKNYGSKQLDRAMVPEEFNEAQQVMGNEILMDRVGLTGKDLSTKSVQTHMDDVGKDLENIAATTAPIPFSTNLQNRFGAIRQAVYNNTTQSNPARKRVDEVLTEIYQEFANHGGRLPGPQFRDLISKHGKIHNELLGKSNSPIEQRAGYKIKSVLLDLFEGTSPTDAAAYAKAREQYRILLALEPLSNNSGRIDMTKLLKQVERQRLTGDVETLAKAGKHMTPLTPTGGIAPTAGAKLPEFLKYPLAGLAGAAAYGAKDLYPYMEQTISELGMSPLGITGGAAAAAGAKYLANSLLQKALTSPIVGRNVLNQNPLITTMAAPLTAIAPATGSNLATEVGFKKRRKK